MSRLANKPLVIPTGVTVTVNGSTVTVKGPKGELSREFPTFVEVTVDGSNATTKLTKDHRSIRPMLGTAIAHVRNMIQGVSAGFQKKLIVEGVGFKWEVKGSDVHLALGFSHPVVVAIPKGLTVATVKGEMTIDGIDKDLLGQFAANIRALKKPEPYKGKGIRYSDEVIRRKQGKKS
jgi:large subunit ribosomal protein L6